MSQVLFILSGSIACYKACEAVSQLVQRGHRVRIVATEAALRFVGAATLEGLTGERVATDLFAAGTALDHIALTRWADLTIVCPATANTLNRMAAGIGDDLAGALLLAHDLTKPLLVAPAMNPAMWNHPATRAAVNRMDGWGVRFVLGPEGRTACGEVGEGRLAEPDAIVAAVEAALARPARVLRVLITSGGTTEPIDGVRVLANTSTGGTGALIANHLARCGHTVTLLRARNARAAAALCRDETFVSFAELDAALARELGENEYDVVIHAAAVSDFSIDSIEINGVVQPPGTAKIPSESAPTLKLRRNPKLLDTLRARSRQAASRIVAFKLTSGADAVAVRAAVMGLFSAGVADFVVHNDLTARRGEGTAFAADIWQRDGTMIERCADRTALATALEKLLVGETVVRENAVAEATVPLLPRVRIPEGVDRAEAGVGPRREGPRPRAAQTRIAG